MNAILSTAFNQLLGFVSSEPVANALVRLMGAYKFAAFLI